MKPKIIQQGAEAVISLENSRIHKRRIPKSYRIPKLDNKLRKTRTKKESKLLEKASKLIPTPQVIKTSLEKKEIEMEFIKGKKLSETLEALPNPERICKEIGKNIAKLHDADIIHGDLTTSNMILSRDEKVFFIDFGLGYESSRIEDKAVDLHLIKQALEAKHYLKAERFFQKIIEGYKGSKNFEETLKRLEKVEKRGRYKQQY